MNQEFCKPKTKTQFREANRLKFLGHHSKALNLMKSTFSFLKTEKPSACGNKSLALSQTRLQSSLIISLALRHFHV